MKKFYYLVGAFATAAAVFAFFAVLLKKLRISLSIESINDDIDEPDNSDISLSIAKENNEEDISFDDIDFSETEEAIKQELDSMIESEDDNLEDIDVEIIEEN